MDIAKEKEWIGKSNLKEKLVHEDLKVTENTKIKEGWDPRVNEIKWRHTITLKNGQVTPGTKDTELDLKQWKFPYDLFRDKSVIDIGACDGCFSFHAEQMGASKVLAVDPYRWTLDDRWSGMKGFNLAREILESDVKDSVVHLEDISKETVEEWDVSLFMGVFYHLTEPLQILRNVASVTRETLVMETINSEFYTAKRGAPSLKMGEGKVQVHPFFVQEPMLAYYPNDEVEGDYTTWYAPNPAFIENFLKTEGFNKFETRRIYGGSRFITYATRPKGV